MSGATSPFHTVDLGKPAPQADGLISYDFSTGLASWPLPGGKAHGGSIQVDSEPGKGTTVRVSLPASGAT